MAKESLQGLLLVPEIAGYQEFVEEVELVHSGHILTELTELIINANRLDLQMSELDGEAIFFYGGGAPPPLEALLGQITLWLETIHNHLSQLKREIFCRCGACQQVGHLGLRVWGHFGEFGVHSIRNKKAIVGKEIIFMHRLLESTANEGELLLFTAPLVESLEEEIEGRPEFQKVETNLPVFGRTLLWSMDLTLIRDGLPAVPKAEVIQHVDREFIEEIAVKAPMEKVVDTLIDLKNWPDWVEGLSQLQMDHSNPLRSGQHHLCIVENEAIHQTIDRIERTNDRFVLVFRIVPPLPVLKKLFSSFEVRKSDQGVIIRYGFSIVRKPLIGWIFDLTIANKLQGMYRKSMENLKMKLEPA